MLDANANGAEWSSALRGLITSLESRMSALESKQEDTDLDGLRDDLEDFKKVMSMFVDGDVGPGSAVGDGTVDADWIAGGDIVDIKAPNSTFVVAQDTLRKNGKGSEEAYLHWLFQTTRRLFLNGIDPRQADATQRNTAITLESVYVAMDVLPSDKIQRGKDDLLASTPNVGDHSPPPRLSMLDAVRNNRTLVLLGDPGSGKTSLINYLALCMAGARLQPEADWLSRLNSASLSDGKAAWPHGMLIPLRVMLRDFGTSLPVDVKSTSADRLWTHITSELGKRGLDDYAPYLQEALRQGKCMVLLDGLDEVPGRARRRLVRDAVADFADMYCRNRFIVTCRTLSYTDSAWQLADFPTAQLAALDEKQIAMFITAWYKTLARQGRMPSEAAEARATELCTAAYYMQDLAQNPMLLTVMAIVHTFHGTLPYERARLYDECVKLLLWRWQSTKQSGDGEWEPGIANQLGTRDDRLLTALYELAWNAHHTQGKRRGAADMPEKEVLNVLKGFLHNDWGKAQIFCNYIEERAGLLVGRGIRKQTNAEGEVVQEAIYAFPHRTIQEYLAGCYLAGQREFSRMVQTLVRKGDMWREVVLLAAGNLVFNQNFVAKPLDAVNILCPKEPPTNKTGWRAVWWSGEILSLVGVDAAQDDTIGKRVLPRVRRQLVTLIEGGHLTPAHRVEAANALGRLGDPRKGVCTEQPAMVRISSGKFMIGAGDDQHEVSLRPFKMARYPVTNAQFWNFIDSGGYETRRYWTEAGWLWRVSAGDELTGFTGDLRWDIASRPVVGISWYEAMAYTRWLLEQTGKHYRLPTEAEWERAAAGKEARCYPWGNRWRDDIANTQESGVGHISPVGAFPKDVTSEGIFDMAGNTWEWTLNRANSYPYVGDDGREEPEGRHERVVRGGAAFNSKLLARCTYRNWIAPDSRLAFIGMRVVQPIDPPALPAPSKK